MGIISSVIGGIQGAGAVSDAASAVRAGNAKAQGTVTGGVNTANTGIENAAGQAIDYVSGAGSYGQKLVGDATTAAQTGEQTATAGAQAAVQPYMAAGADATTKLSDLAGQKFTFSQDDPSYQFRLQQGQQALERSAAARGGGTAKALAQYGQNMASTEYQNAFNRFNTNRVTSGNMLSTLAGYGLDASKFSGGAGMRGAEYSGDVGFRGAQVGAGIGMDTARYAGDTRMRSAEGQGRNTMFGAEYVGNMDAATGQANAQEHIGRGNVWNSMISDIGKGLDSMITGGFGGGGGFSPIGAITGMPQYGGGGYHYGGFDASNANPVDYYGQMGITPPWR